MTEREIRELRDKIGTDPMLTDEEIEYIWMAMDRQEPMKTILSHGECGCPRCEVTLSHGDGYCWHCGQRLKWTED